MVLINSVKTSAIR